MESRIEPVSLRLVTARMQALGIWIAIGAVPAIVILIIQIFKMKQSS